MRIVLGVMGGIFLLLMISAGYLYNTQNSENIELAKKRITAMLAALVFITFSVLLLRVIGVNILDVTTLGIIG
jgi:EamA domain-containing membrane protein RarD